MEIYEIVEKLVVIIFLEGFMIDNGDSKIVDFEVWRVFFIDNENNWRLVVGVIIVLEMCEVVFKEI